MRALRVGAVAALLAALLAAVVSALAWPRLPALVPPLPGTTGAPSRLAAVLSWAHARSERVEDGGPRAPLQPPHPGPLPGGEGEP